MTAPVSVVIPCFRCADTIRRSVESVCKQALLPAEVILVEDASGDDTLAVLRAIELAYPGWVRVLAADKNQGAASARNAGWAVSSQPFIAFLDADDTWHPEKLRIQYDYMKQNPNIALCGHRCIWLRDDEALPKLPEHLPETRISAFSLLSKNAFSTPTVMLKRDLSFRFLEGKRYAEDLLLWQQITSAGLHVVRLEYPLAFVHKPLYGAGGLSAQLWKMEKGELDNFVFLHQEGVISLPIYIASSVFSLVKFLRRMLLVKFRLYIALAFRKGGIS